MDNCHLDPRASQMLIDSVIREVMQWTRAPPPANTFGPAQTDDQADSDLRAHAFNAVSKFGQVAGHSNRTASSASSSTHKPPKRGSAAVDNVASLQSEQLLRLTKSIAATRKESLRKRHRMYQARYRRQYQEKVATLEHDIQHLRAETQGLELQCHLGFSGSGVDDNVWMIAAEYFRLFRYGFRSSIPALRTSYNARATSGTAPSVESRTQQEFLRENMTPDLAEELITGWTLRSLYHADLNMELQSLEAGAGSTLIATANVSTTINEITLRHAFPHLTYDAEGGEWSLLATKLLCQQVTTTVSIQFEWDHTYRHVTSLLCKVDMLTPLLDLLGNLEDVSRVFDNAFIALDGSLVSRKIYY